MSLLESLHSKAKYAIGMTEQARDSIDHPGGLWYHAIGMLNAYYALREELTKRTKNTSDQILSGAIDRWLNSNKGSMNAFFGNARNIATHQGDIEVNYFTDVDEDYALDHDVFYRSARISIKGTSIQAMTARDFLARCDEAFSFFEKGIIAIDLDYRKAGGLKNGIPEEEDLTHVFKDLTL